MQTPLTELSHLIKGKIISRPSKICRSPYVADVLLETGEQVIAHAPSLGCCGYVDKNENVLLVPHENPKTCSHVIHLAQRFEKEKSYLIGVHPKSAEKLVKKALHIGCIESLDNLTEIKSEQCYLNSRFDFVCKDKNGTETIIEVKNVPCGDYEDIVAKDRKKKDYSNRDINSKIAYFPDGYRKKSTDTISPRALKHIQELEKLKIENENIRCIIIFVVQRDDCEVFQGSNVDPIYKNALNEAYKNGVEVLPVKMVWDENGVCSYKGVINFVL
jgi:DNA-binding sugar fermentation-stimulating protein